MTNRAKYDPNLKPTLIAIDMDDAAAIVAIEADPATGRLLVDALATITGSVDTELPAAAALADNTANPTTTSVGTFPHWYDGATWDRARGDSTDGLLVNLGANNDVTVTGTVTANAGTNLNTSLLALESGGNLAAAATSLQKIDNFISGSRGLVTEDNSASILTSVQLIDDAVHAEDSAFANADKGMAAMAVRTDSPADKSGTDGDYEPLQISGGLLWARIRGIQTPNGDTAMDDVNDALRVNIVAGAAAGGTSSTDDAAFTAAAGAGTPIMGFVTADSVDSGDVGVLAMLANRQLKVTLFDSGGSELSVGGGTQYTEDAAAAANPVGNALNLIRDDARGGSLTSTDGDNVAARGTNAGELYVKHVDSIPVTDNGGSLTVDNAGLTALNGAISGTEVQVDIVSSALPSGAATSARQDTMITSLQLIDDVVFAEDATHTSGDKGIMALAVRNDGLAATLTSTDGDYSPIAVNSVGRVFTSAVIDTALPAGTNAIGKLASNSGVDIGDVDVTSIIPGTGATNLGKAEDNPHSSGDVGVMALGVRNDAGATTIAGSDGDYSPIATDLKGRTIVTQKAATGTQSSVAGSASSGTILASNTDRAGATVYNDSSAQLYLRLSSSAASSSNFTVMLDPYDYYEVPAGYTGQITGIWASATGNARVTEVSS